MNILVNTEMMYLQKARYCNIWIKRLYLLIVGLKPEDHLRIFMHSMWSWKIISTKAFLMVVRVLLMLSMKEFVSTICSPDNENCLLVQGFKIMD